MSLKKYTTTLLVAAALSFASVPAVQAFPDKDIDFIIPYTPGGGFDRTVRMLIPFMEKYLPKKVNVLPKNIPGAGGRKGIATLYRAAPDGHTIAIFNMPGFAVPHVLGQEVAYDLNKITWLGTVSATGYVLAVHKNSSVKSVDDLRKMGGKLKVPVTGKGSTAYFATVIANDILGIDAEYITGYKGSSDYILGLVRGDGEAAYAPASSARKFVQAGDLVPLLSIGGVNLYPGVPEGKDVGKPELAGLGLERMIGAPPGVDPAVAKVLADALAKSLADPELIAMAEKAQESLLVRGPEDTAAAYQQMMHFYSQYKEALAE